MSARRQRSQNRTVIDLTNESGSNNSNASSNIPNSSVDIDSNTNSNDLIITRSMLSRDAPIPSRSRAVASGSAINLSASLQNRSIRTTRTSNSGTAGSHSNRGRGRGRGRGGASARRNNRTSNSDNRGWGMFINSPNRRIPNYIDDFLTMVTLVEYMQGRDADSDYNSSEEGPNFMNNFLPSYERLIEMDRESNFGKKRLAFAELKKLPTRKFSEAPKTSMKPQLKTETDSKGKQVYVLVDSDEEPPAAAQKTAEASPEQCVVCLSEFKPSDTIRDLPCKHFFHKSCIDKWLGTDHSCPICRFDLSSKS